MDNLYRSERETYTGPVQAQDVDETFRSIDLMLADAESWAKGGYKVHVAGAAFSPNLARGWFEHRVGYVEVTWDEGVKWFPSHLTYTYKPDHYTTNVIPPKVFAMYTPQYIERTGRWRLSMRGAVHVPTANYIWKRAMRQGYVPDDIAKDWGAEGNPELEVREFVKGRAHLKVSITHGMKGGPQVVIEHFGSE